ncbi:MAG: cbb3-type cytochrome c oxidase subunit 3 [Pseudomonadota bacterium]
METYSSLRAFADSWAMLAILVFFLAIVARVVFAKRGKYQDTAEIPFRHEDKPLPDAEPDSDAGKEDKEALK